MLIPVENARNKVIGNIKKEKLNTKAQKHIKLDSATAYIEYITNKLA